MPMLLTLRVPFDALRLVCALALVVVGVSAARRSEAQEPASQQPIFVTFEYRAPAVCMGEEQAFSLLHRRSRRVVRAHGSLAQQQLGMKVVSHASGFRGVLTVTRAGQTPERRAMAGGSCDEVVEALALTAALSIDPDATVTLDPVDPETSSVEGTAPGGREAPTRRGLEDDEDDDEDDASPETETASGAFGSNLQITLGPTLAVARLMDHTMHFGGGVLLAVSRPDRATLLPLEARVSVYGLVETAAAREPGVRTSFVGARLAYCPVRVGGDHSLLLCPVSQMGALVAESRGFGGSTDTTRFFATLGLEAWSRARISRHLDLWLSPSVEVPLTKRSFAVEPGPEILASTARVVWGVAAGIGWNF